MTVVCEFNGEKYARASSHQKEWGSAIISQLPLDGGEMILDLGCGDGVLTEQLARRVPAGSVVGIDSSWGMVRTAKRLEGGNLTFRLMDMRYLNVRDTFDVIFSNATLQWITDHRRLLRVLYAALKPGGWFRVNFAGHGNCANFFAVVRRAMADDRFAEYFDQFDWPWYTPTVAEYEDVLTRSDFRSVSVFGENADRFFDDAEQMTRWLDQPCLVPFLRRLPRDRRRAFRDTVVEQMIERTRQVDGRCFETFRRINAFARK